MARKDELLGKAMGLSPEERAELSDELLDSVEGEERAGSDGRSRAVPGVRASGRGRAMEELLEKALDLSPEDRVALAYELLDSVEGEEEGEDDPESVEEQWGDELVRRLDDLRSGRVKGLDGFEVIRQEKAELEEWIRKEQGRSR